MVGQKAKGKQKIQGEGRYGRYKSKKSYRMVFVKTPGGETTTHYKKKKPVAAKCASCGAKLPGISRERPYKMQNMPKTAKKSERPFGGYYCSKCARNEIKQEARK